MSISSSSVLLGSTVSASGGTSTNLLSKGGDSNHVAVLIDDSSEFMNQKTAKFFVAEPRPQASAPNGYTQSRATLRLLFPINLDNGSRSVNTLEIKLGVDIETTEAEIAEYQAIAAQFMTGSAFSDFWVNRSIA